MVNDYRHRSKALDRLGPVKGQRFFLPFAQLGRLDPDKEKQRKNDEDNVCRDADRRDGLEE